MAMCVITVNLKAIFRHLDATLPKYQVRYPRSLSRKCQLLVPNQLTGLGSSLTTQSSEDPADTAHTNLQVLL